jgi:hypothetical protein
MPEPLLPAVGRFDGDDPRQGQLLGQAVLEGSKGALGTAAGLRASTRQCGGCRAGPRPGHLSAHRLHAAGPRVVWADAQVHNSARVI